MAETEWRERICSSTPAHSRGCTSTIDGDHRRALELQGLLALEGHHRAVSLVDALVAAIAESRGLTVLHYDADLELLCAITGRPHRWIVDRGTAD